MSELTGSDFPEAPASVTYTLVSPVGKFPVLFTIRAKSGTQLLEKMDAIEGALIARNYQPQEKGGYPRRTEKPKEYVPNRACPKCGAPLIYFEIKSQPGVKQIKCSAGRYDFATKRNVGCDFVEWVKDSPTATPLPNPQSPNPTPMTFGDPATPAQLTLIQAKLPQFYRPNLTRLEANALISQNLNK